MDSCRCARSPLAVSWNLPNVCSASRKNSGALCFNASALKARERLAQVGQRLVLQRALFRNQLFRRRPAGFRGGPGVAGFGELAAQLGQFRFALGDLLAQFIFQPRIRTAATPAAVKPAEEKTQHAANQQCNHELYLSLHNIVAADVRRL